MTSIALIPCRGGSKGIPRKNLQFVHGVPLVVRSINACMKAGVEHVFVSTDDEIIAAYALAAGAEVLERPSELAQDKSSTDDVLNHAIETLIGKGFVTDDFLLLLQATSPFTRPQTIRKAVELLEIDPSRGVFTATDWHGFIWNIENEIANPHLHDHLNRSRRQDLGRQVLETGGVYGGSIGMFINTGVRFIDPLTPILVDRIESIEVDTWEDLEFCNSIEVGIQSQLNQTIKVLFTDFDGVWTNNLVQQGTQDEISVSINRSDGVAVNELRQRDIPTIIITGEKAGPAFGRAKKLEIQCLFAEDKLARIIEYCTKNSLKLSEVAYIGNDVNDLGPIASCGWSFVPSDAHPSVARYAGRILSSRGGEGVLREFNSLFS